MYLDPQFEVIATGNELLDSSTYDCHTQSIARALKNLGLRLRRSRVLRDNPQELQSAFSAACLESEIVFVTGGLGPTEDDLSLQSAADTFGREMLFSKEAEANVKARLKVLGRDKLNPGHKKQMYIPSGSEVLPNRQGTAPGVEMSVGACIFYFMPGVPKEFEDVFFHAVLPRLERRYGKKEAVYEDKIFKIFGWPESSLSALVKDLKAPDFVEVGYRTSFPENHLKLKYPAKLSTKEARSIADFTSSLRKRLEGSIFAEDLETEFEESILSSLKSQKLKVSLAESCTGGLASAYLTRVPGSSACLDRSFIVYSNEAKQDLLAVSKETLQRAGAVSEDCVLEMVRGALENSNADRAVAISGIAGPAGGTRDKPVGTVWFAYADRKSESAVLKSLIGFSRKEIQIYSAYFALHALASGKFLKAH